MRLSAQIPPVQTKPKPGCLGWLTRIVVLLILGSLAVLLIWAVFAPWSFFLGGSFHPLGMWQGWGRMHSTKAGGDYVLFVRMWPGRGSRVTGFPGVTGTAILCTPRNERFSLRLGGSILNKHVGLNTDGQPMHLYMYYRPFWYNFTTERRPGIELYGKWQGSNLVMDDHSSLARAFLPDSSVDRGSRKNLPWMIEVVPIALAPGSQEEFNSACAAIANRQ
jgi:hypothetical protein